MIECNYKSPAKISDETFEEIYNRIKTPYKYGAVIKFDDHMADSPTVFKYNGKWYMYYVRIAYELESSGYETHFSSSDDLINWKYEGVILNKGDSSKWDSGQCGGYAAFLDMNFGGTNEIATVNSKYYISYLGGAGNGYEPDPLHMGLAWSDNPISPDGFTKIESPILSPHDADAREYEKKTLYKSNMLIDDKKTLGYRYLNYYNGKDVDGHERIFLAVSNDGENWERFGKNPLIDRMNDTEKFLITGDPQVTKIGDIYVMFYFVLDDKYKTYNTFALSTDLVNWTNWQGEPLIQSEFEWENVYAHKSYVVKHDGLVYHYYCAVNDKDERFIALATSEKIRKW